MPFIRDKSDSAYLSLDIVTLVDMCAYAGGGERAGGAIGVHGGGSERGVTARGTASRAIEGRLCWLVVRAACR